VLSFSISDRKENMSINELSKAKGFERLITRRALTLASHSLVLVSALLAAPAIQADCLPPVPSGWQIPFYMSTHNVTTHAVSYATGNLGDFSSLFVPSVLSGDNFVQVFSDRLASLPCGPEPCFGGSQPFDVGNPDYIGVSITRTPLRLGYGSTISVTLTLDTWGNTKYTFTGVCDAKTNLLYGSYDNNTMTVFSFGEPFNVPQ
jgi:hypothetical protein